jgi:hypothetical protein
LKIATSLLAAANSDAQNKIKVLSLRSRGILDWDILDHAADSAQVIQSEFDPQAFAFHFLVPKLLVVSGFYYLFRPILQADKV